MEYLSMWLLLVAGLRMIAVVSGYLDPSIFHRNVFRTGKGMIHMTGLAGRLFSAWCSITAALCFVLASNLHNSALYAVTFFSFLVAFVFFVLEVVVYRTVDFRGVAIQAVVATTSLVWLAQNANYRTGAFTQHLKLDL